MQQVAGGGWPTLPMVTFPDTVGFDEMLTYPFAPTPAPAPITFVVEVELQAPDAVALPL